MWGNPQNLASMHRIMKETRIHEESIEPDGAALHVMLPETNQAESTYDGIDWGGERVAAEASIFIHRRLITSLIAFLQIFQEIEKLEKEGKTVTRFSVTGYSLGGLLARYVVGYVLLPHCPHLTYPRPTGICPSTAFSISASSSLPSHQSILTR
jgi:hypothetical protein